MKNKAIFKYNSGLLALLCSECRTIIKTGIEFTDKERKACNDEVYLEPQYCELHDTECPNCISRENFHYNHDYSKKDMPIIDITCNECGTTFKQK